MVADKSVAYTASWYPHHIGPDLDEIKESGCTSVTLTVSEIDWNIFSRSRRIAVQMAHERGLKAYINIRGFGVFPTYQIASEYLMRNPEKRQVFSDGRSGTSACPNDPDYLSWLKLTTFEMIEYFEADGTFWDEPSFQPAKDFPTTWACRCKHCKERYYEEHLSEMPTRPTDKVLKFRQESLVRFLTELIANSKSAGSKLDFLCLSPLDRAPHRGILDIAARGVTDWRPFSRIPGLDVISTNPYWIHNDYGLDFLIGNAVETIEIAKKQGRKSQIWVQTAWVPDGREPDIEKSIETVVSLGADMVGAWAYRGEPGSEIHMAGDPELAWQTLAAAYRRI